MKDLWRSQDDQTDPSHSFPPTRRFFFLFFLHWSEPSCVWILKTKIPNWHSVTWRGVCTYQQVARLLARARVIGEWRLIMNWQYVFFLSKGEGEKNLTCKTELQNSKCTSSNRTIASCARNPCYSSKLFSQFQMNLTILSNTTSCIQIDRYRPRDISSMRFKKKTKKNFSNKNP